MFHLYSLKFFLIVAFYIIFIHVICDIMLQLNRDYNIKAKKVRKNFGPKVGLYNPRRKNNLQDYFYLRFGRPQSCSKLGNLLFESHNLSKIKKCSVCYIFILVPKVGLYNPRRKNNLQDYFYLRFGRPQTCSKLGNLLFESHIKNQKQRNTEKICVSLFLVPKVGLEPTWFPARF